MSLDLSSLLAQVPLRKPRRPVAEEMLSIRVRDVRPLVEVNQQTVHLPQMCDPVCPVYSKPCRKLFVHSWSERISHPLGEVGGPPFVR